MDGGGGVDTRLNVNARLGVVEAILIEKMSISPNSRLVLIDAF